MTAAVVQDSGEDISIERSARPKPQIPHILPSDASAIRERCDQILEGSRELLAHLQNVGVAELFTRLDDSVLQLAIQPGLLGRAHQGATDVRSRSRPARDPEPWFCHQY